MFGHVPPFYAFRHLSHRLPRHRLHLAQAPAKIPAAPPLAASLLVAEVGPSTCLLPLDSPLPEDAAEGETGQDLPPRAHATLRWSQNRKFRSAEAWRGRKAKSIVGEYDPSSLLCTTSFLTTAKACLPLPVVVVEGVRDSSAPRSRRVSAVGCAVHVHWYCPISRTHVDTNAHSGPNAVRASNRAHSWSKRTISVRQR